MSTCSAAASYFSDPATACAVCQAESGGRPDAHNHNPPIEDSYGLFQINALAHPTFDTSRGFDPNYNAQYAASLQAQQGWGPWSTYTSGLYRRYLGSCGGTASSSVTSSSSAAPAGAHATVSAALGGGALRIAAIAVLGLIGVEVLEAVA